MNYFVAVAFAAGLLGDPIKLRGQSATANNPGIPWPATDALRRSLPMPHEVGTPKTNRFVGIFYFLWHDGDAVGPRAAGPHDITKILAQDPEASHKPDSPLWGPIGSTHYWGESLYGYYQSADPWVLRRHAQLLADAGVDVLIFDTTNARWYPEVYHALCKTFAEIRQDGGRTPQIAFMLNTRANETARGIYDDLYKPGLFRELWFIWRGKPLMICDPAQASEDLRRFFTLRRAHWPFTMTNTPYAWHWEATYPQPFGYEEDPNQPEEVNVSVAQNLRAKDGEVTNMSTGEARGRSFHDGNQRIAPGSVNNGFNFQEQWKRALELQPPFVMVTGWNEWKAGRFGKLHGPLTFVDQFDEEFSRDIEPMRFGHGDNYYYQLVANIRRYKGAPPLPAASPPRTIQMEGSFDQWRGVQPEFMDDIGDTTSRDFEGVGGLRYTNSTGRNDFAALKVARDGTNVFFYARTREAITPATGSNWMWLLIDADQNPQTGWEGYDFIVNRFGASAGMAWIEKNQGGWNWKKVGSVPIHVQGNELHLAIPRSLIGLQEGTSSISLDFKWADNLQSPGDIMDFYLSGDVAPNGRFKFRFSAGGK